MKTVGLIPVSKAEPGQEFIVELGKSSKILSLITHITPSEVMIPGRPQDFHVQIFFLTLDEPGEIPIPRRFHLVEPRSKVPDGATYVGNIIAGPKLFIIFEAEVKALFGD